MKHIRLLRRFLPLVLLAGIVGATLAETEAEAYRRRYRVNKGLGAEMMAERWSGYRRAMLSSRSRPRLSYNPVSFSSREQSSRPRSRVAQQSQQQPPIAAATNYATTRTNSGVLSEQNVYNFRRQFADGQSRKAMRSALGEPAEHTWNKDVWKIERIGLDGKKSGEFGTFEATYDWGDGGWQGSTTNPPKANW